MQGTVATYWLSSSRMKEKSVDLVEAGMMTKSIC